MQALRVTADLHDPRPPSPRQPAETNGGVLQVSGGQGGSRAPRGEKSV